MKSPATAAKTAVPTTRDAGFIVRTASTGKDFDVKAVEAGTIFGDMPLLVPGVGAQGADVAQAVKAGVRNAFDIPSRSISRFATSSTDTPVAAVMRPSAVTSSRSVATRKCPAPR